MVQSILITGGTTEERLAFITEFIEKKFGLSLKKNHPDILIVEGLNSIGIEQIRELKSKLSLKPYQVLNKVAVILEAEKITLPAQNAFLKTLEEPPANSFIILGAPALEFLLPTIVSRCQVVKVPQDFKTKLKSEDFSLFFKILTSISSKSPSERLKLAERFSWDKPTALDFIQSSLLAGQELIKTKPCPTLLHNLRLFQKTQPILLANVNPRLAIGNLFLLLS